MSVQAIFAPVFAQAALMFVLMFWMGHLRVTALRKREARLGDIALREPNWPAKVTQVSNSFDNQFQLPVLFFVIVLVAYFTKLADFVFVVLSWLFVATRIVHAGVHVTTNTVQQRFAAYVVGSVILLIMWAMVAVRLFVFAA